MNKPAKPHRTLLMMAVVLAGSLAAADRAAAQSLFERRSVNQVDQYRNYAARNKGDLLFILINENTDVENRDERSLDKTGNSSINGDIDFLFGGALGNSAGAAQVGYSSDSQRGFTGDTEFRSERAI